MRITFAGNNSLLFWARKKEKIRLCSFKFSIYVYIGLFQKTLFVLFFFETGSNGPKNPIYPLYIDYYQAFGIFSPRFRGFFLASFSHNLSFHYSPEVLYRSAFLHVWWVIDLDAYFIYFYFEEVHNGFDVIWQKQILSVKTIDLN